MFVLIIINFILIIIVIMSTIITNFLLLHLCRNLLKVVVKWKQRCCFYTEKGQWKGNQRIKSRQHSFAFSGRTNIYFPSPISQSLKAGGSRDGDALNLVPSSSLAQPCIWPSPHWWPDNQKANERGFRREEEIANENPKPTTKIGEFSGW